MVVGEEEDDVVVVLLVVEVVVAVSDDVTCAVGGGAYWSPSCPFADGKVDVIRYVCAMNNRPGTSLCSPRGLRCSVCSPVGDFQQHHHSGGSSALLRRCGCFHVVDDPCFH